jgi:DNA-binding transcriptional MerR regulator
MDLTIGDLVEQTGVAPRTIREYVRLEMLPRPTGLGPAALYTKRHLLLLSAIVRLRAEGMLLEDIKEQLAGMTPQQLARYAPKPPPKPAPEPPPAVEAAVKNEPAAPPKALEMPPHRAGESLPEGPRWVLVSLLPGMALMVRDDAAAIVRRAATEIIDRYGTPG